MKKAIYLIDLTHESPTGFGSDTMPLQLGLIGSYCLKKYGDKVDISIFKFNKEFIKAVKERQPFIIGVSNYLWNIDLGYKFISEVKKKYPQTIIVYGGPNYPEEQDRQIKFLKEYPNIDIYINKDGELPFSRLVGFLLKNPNVQDAKRSKLPSCHALIDGVPFFGEIEKRLEDLSVVPPAYTTGLLDKFFEYPLIPSIRTNRGCPFGCAYCTEGNPYYNRIFTISLESKKNEIDHIVKKIKHTKTLRIADSNFGMFPEDIEFCEYLSKIQKKTGFPEYVCCATGKNQKDRVFKCNELLRGAMRLTASVQSLNKQVLIDSRRINISLDDIMALSDKVSDTDTFSYSEIILGLPSDSLVAEKESMEGLTRAGISNITQHQLSIICGSFLGSPKVQEKFGLKIMFRPIQRCAGVYSVFGESFSSVEIEDICVGTDNLTFDDYIEARRIYLTVGMFYNDRIFAEIHTLLRLLHLSTWEWLMKIHKNIDKGSSKIKDFYDGFTKDTKNELWENRADLISDVFRDIDQYSSGKLGGNIIYKYRSKAIIFCFSELHQTAFKHLREYLNEKGVSCDEVVCEAEKMSQYQKGNLFNTDFEVDEVFQYDIIKMIKEPALARNGGSIEDIHYPNRVYITHTDKQKEMINRQLKTYGATISGLTMLLSRFPIKLFYRKAVVKIV